MTNLLAIDPGKMTGWSELSYTSNSYTLHASAELSVDEVWEVLVNGLDDPEGPHPDRGLQDHYRDRKTRVP